MVGICGVLSYTVAQRTHEIGIRMALGANRSTVRAMIMRQGLAITGLGVLLGIAGALAIAGWLSSMLFEVQPQDPAVLADVALAPGVVATTAGYLPARRATSVHTMLTLRGHKGREPPEAWHRGAARRRRRQLMKTTRRR